MNYLLLCLMLVATFSNVRASSFLIGGRLARAGEYESSVQLIYAKGLCTSAKIGPRTFLTAAHCIVKKDVKDYRLKVGDSIKLRTNASARTISTSVREIIINPNYLNKVKNIFKNASHYRNAYPNLDVTFLINASFKNADLAVVKVNKESNEIPVAKIDFRVIPFGEKMIIGGFGCHKFGERSVTDNYIAEVTNVSNGKKMAMGDNPFPFLIEEMGEDQAPIHHLLVSFNKDKAASCPGDSGGPAYRKSNKKIIGINSFVTLKNRQTDISHITRLSGSEAWLKKVTKDFTEN